MEQFILKEKIKEAIESREVKAVLFYSFNFDPRFFENYVMPLFVPCKDFRDEVIHNRILWRSCLKEGIIPPVTVYCDYFAKDNSEAPSLAYDIYCIRMPAANGSICNFHAKQILILLADLNFEESLVVITGSGNLTPTGWCDNFESFSMQEIKKDKRSPNKTTTNVLQEVISNTNGLAGLKEKTKAEKRIYNYLNYVDHVGNYFNSFQQSFKENLSKEVFSKDEIFEVEIVSPYFCQDHSLVRYLKDEIGIKKVNCLLPTFKNNEVQLSRDVFKLLTEEGVTWCKWNTYRQNCRIEDRNKEVRKLHSKIYRFYGRTKTYTFIGSVNFTIPAWSKYGDKNNKANIENGWLYDELAGGSRMLKKLEEVNLDHYLFIDKPELENGEIDAVFTRKVPDFTFVIDWRVKTLTIKGRGVNNICFLSGLSYRPQIGKGEIVVELPVEDVKALSKNALIKVVEQVEDNEIVHTYYPIHLHIDMKPLEIKLTTINILKYWDFLDDDKKREAITRSYAERMTNDLGYIDEDQIETRNVLNEMAAHFSSLVRLEKHLFPHYLKTQLEQKQKFKNLEYFLVSDNIDTLPFYLDNLSDQLEEKKVYNSFCWIVYQIVLENFYGKALKWEYRKQIEKEDWNKFKIKLHIRMKEIQAKADGLHKELDITEQQIKWCIEQIAMQYE